VDIKRSNYTNGVLQAGQNIVITTENARLALRSRASADCPYPPHLDVNEPAVRLVLWARMIARRRMDDINAEEVERRLNWFESDVLPAVEYFRKHSKYNFIELDGHQPVEAVQQELRSKTFG